MLSPTACWRSVDRHPGPHRTGCGLLRSRARAGRRVRSLRHGGSVRALMCSGRRGATLGGTRPHSGAAEACTEEVRHARSKTRQPSSWPASESPSPASPGRPRTTAAMSSTSAARAGLRRLRRQPERGRGRGRPLLPRPALDPRRRRRRRHRAPARARRAHDARVRDLGIKHVWMHRGPGAEACPAAADYGRRTASR